MNSNGLALIVGALVIAVAALIFFNPGIFHRGGGSSGGGDINVTVETPAPAPAN